MPSANGICWLHILPPLRNCKRAQQVSLTCVSHANSIERMSKMIQLRNVPDSLHRQLKARAALAGMALSDFLIREVRKIAEYPTPEEMRERLAQRDAYRGKLSPTDIL